MKLLAITTLMTLCGAAQGETLTVKLVDDTNQPVTNIAVQVGYISPVSNQWVNLKPVSDATGKVVAEIERRNGWIIRIDQAGFYYTLLDSMILFRNPELNRIIVMRRIINPIPLLALGEGHPAGGRMPAKGEWVGFDFEVGDWVSPHGNGKAEDIRLKFTNTFSGYLDHIKDLEAARATSKRAFAARKEEWTEEKFKLWNGKWNAELDISFPGEQEGIIEERDRFLPYCRLKMPHQAPEVGYQPTRHYSVTNSYRSENMGFFLRTRVKRDEKGQIISAHYTKIMGDFSIGAAGGVTFHYYFNPTPNDRNLEFDVEKNLFPPEQFGPRPAAMP